MIRSPKKLAVFAMLGIGWWGVGGFLSAQVPKQASAAPKVVVKTGNQASASAASRQTGRILYPWKTYVTSTIFWVGEQPTERNPTPNCKSSWDQAWAINFGGYDDPNPENRIANHSTGEFRPKAFIPKLNPFYVALPYNDVKGWGAHKPEAARVIPWFSRMRPAPGKTVLKGRWVQIFCGGRSCFAQWEDCGPWTTDDWEYVFGTKPPMNKENGGAGIDLSPAIRDYFGLKSGQKVHWRFVEASQVPYGPWRKYGNAPSASPSPGAIPGATSNESALVAEQRYLEQLRKLRDAEFQKKSAREIQSR